MQEAIGQLFAADYRASPKTFRAACILDAAPRTKNPLLRLVWGDEQAASRNAEGNTSFEDCDALTWSLGWTGAPRRCEATLARTSLAFMLVLVP